MHVHVYAFMINDLSTLSGKTSDCIYKTTENGNLNESAKPYALVHCLPSERKDSVKYTLYKEGTVRLLLVIYLSVSIFVS